MANTKITTDVIADGAITSAKLDTNITISGDITGTLATAAQPNITSLGTLTALTGGTGDLNWDSGTLFVDSSANSVGIGTSSPSTTLHVTSPAGSNKSAIITRTSGAEAINLSEMQDYNALQILNKNSGSYLNFAGNASHSSIQAQSNGSTAEDIALNPYGGNVGIGMTPAPVGSDTVLALYNSATPRIKLHNAATGTAGTDGGEINMSSTNLIIENREAANIKFYNNGSQRFNIDNRGNLSFGSQTSDPVWSQFFNAISSNHGGHVSFQSNSFPNTSLGNNFYINNSTQNQRVLGYPTQQFKLDHQGNFLFESAASGTAGATFSFTEKMRLTNEGALGINSTSDSFNGMSTGRGHIFRPNGESFHSTNDAGSQNTLHVYDYADSTYRFYVRASGSSAGNIYATNTSITGLSDKRLKENIVDLETGLTEVMALQPRRFDWKNGDAQNVAGFIAQEVESVLPELVGDYKHEELEDCKSLKMGDIVPTLVKAIQEQQTIIDDLKTRIETLEG